MFDDWIVTIKYSEIKVGRQKRMWERVHAHQNTETKSVDIYIYESPWTLRGVSEITVDGLLQVQNNSQYSVFLCRRGHYTDLTSQAYAGDVMNIITYVLADGTASCLIKTDVSLIFQRIYSGHILQYNIPWRGLLKFPALYSDLLNALCLSAMKLFHILVTENYFKARQSIRF